MAITFYKAMKVFSAGASAFGVVETAACYGLGAMASGHTSLITTFTFMMMYYVTNTLQKHEATKTKQPVVSTKSSDWLESKVQTEEMITLKGVKE